MLLNKVKTEILDFLNKTYSISNPVFDVMSTRSLEDGDFFTNVALKYSNLVNKKPLEMANEINEYLKSTELTQYFTTEIKQPGFINFYLNNKYLVNLLQESQQNNFFNTINIKVNDILVNNKNITVEFTDPNPFKEFHIGHLMSNSIGESISRLLENANANVRRVCYQGDVGMHVAKSIWGLIKQLENANIKFKDLSNEPLNKRIKFLGKSYALGANSYKEDKKAKKEIEELNYILYLVSQERLVEKEKWTPQISYSNYVKESKYDKKYVKELYIKGREWSLEYFENIYMLLGTDFGNSKNYYFESEVGEYGMKIVKEYLKKDLFIKDDGAVIFPGEKYELHNRVFINSKGLPTYEAKELGLAPKKYQDHPYDLSIIVTGNEIDDYFKVLLKALEKIKPNLAKKTLHISHGMMRLKGAGKMSSRSGKIITGENLIEDTQKLFIDKMKKKNDIEIQSSKLKYRDISNTKNKLTIPEKVAIGAIKYSILKVGIGKNIEFNFEQSINIQGNSGPYIQYTNARARSVLRKIKSKTFNSSEFNFNEDEKTLARTIFKFSEEVERATEELAPHHICHYLFDLCQKYNTFYSENKIIKSDKEALRILLTDSTSKVIEKGLYLLGIPIPNKM